MDKLTEASLVSLATSTIALQFVFFGWRLLREIAIGDKPPPSETEYWRMRFPWCDWINLFSLASVTVACLVVPIVTERFGRVSRAVLAGAIVLWLCHPISIACHYELFRGGRQLIYGDPKTWPQTTKSERVVTFISRLLRKWSHRRSR